jgi:hypothetical protein
MLRLSTGPVQFTVTPCFDHDAVLPGATRSINNRRPAGSGLCRFENASGPVYLGDADSMRHNLAGGIIPSPPPWIRQTCRNGKDTAPVTRHATKTHNLAALNPYPCRWVHRNAMI